MAGPRVEPEPNQLDGQGRIAMAARRTQASFSSLRGFLAACLLLVAMACAVSGSALAKTAPDPGSLRARLDNVRADLAQIETTLASPNPSDAELQRLRLRLQPSLDQLRLIIDEQTPRVEQAKLRLDQLGPKPEASAPAESAEIVRDREARAKAFADAD